MECLRCHACLCWARAGLVPCSCRAHAMLAVLCFSCACVCCAQTYCACTVPVHAALVCHVLLSTARAHCICSVHTCEQQRTVHTHTRVLMCSMNMRSLALHVHMHAHTPIHVRACRCVDVQRAKQHLCCLLVSIGTACIRVHTRPSTNPSPKAGTRYLGGGGGGGVFSLLFGF